MYEVVRGTIQAPRSLAPKVKKASAGALCVAVTKRAGRKKDANANQTASQGGRGGKAQVKKATFESSKKKEVGVSDLTLISKISNEAINDNLKKRFENGEIYTYIGHVLVSVNPFRDLGIYTDAVLASYRGKNRLEVPPHVFAVAESAYYNMKGYNENQCVIISGESGAGKTEAAKRIMQYIANVSEGKDSSIQQIKDMVLATNPLLESFGNAKTLRNNNSSRFGKYLQLQFNAQGEPVGATITNYLLEKSRVVGQIANERNFHIFYQFTKAASSHYRETFGVQEPTTYIYTSRSKCYDVAGIDDVADFRDTINAMKIIGLSQAEQDDIFRMLAVVLWIGNVHFLEDKDGNAAIADTSVTDFVAYLLEVDAAHVTKAFTSRVVETSRGGRRGSVYEVPLNPTQATAVRDALAKAVYYNLFDWIVTRVNVSLQARGVPAQSIGILDIYGFEIFERNSFEQLCINYVNEKLQQIFIQLTLKTEQEEYAREQIQWTPISYFDNKVVCELIEERRPPGVFAALNDACATAHADPGAADQSFVQKLNGLLSNHAHFQPRQGQFIIKHYAGDVSYAVDGMTDKNKDQLLKDLLNLVGETSNAFLRGLFPNQVDQDSKKRPPTAGDKIKASANELVATLTQASPSYIRTIKPNENKSPTEYHSPNVLHQIKYLGLQENVRIRRAGFAYRQTFDKFVERFYLLSPRTSYAGEYTWTGDARSGAQQILRDTSIPAEEFQMGVTKAFIKTPETLFALEHMRDRYWHNMATRIQRAWRNYLRYRIECAIRIQRFWRKLKGGLEYIQLRDFGHQVLQGKKERRRFSLIGSRRFLGDYLAVGKNGGFGEMIRTSVNIGGAETVIFSCRCDVLVTKFGRSSKPSPRNLVLTKRNVYLVVSTMVNHQLAISAERTIPLGAIRYVGTSMLKDDWFSLGVGSPQEPDPLINCVFKTEFFTHLTRAVPGGLDLRIAESIEYNKKPGKPTLIKVIRDPAVARDDLYKSGTIHTGPGEPPTSVSRPTPRPNPTVGKPITKGKLLRPGGPGGGPSKLSGARPAAARPVAQPLPASTASHASRLPPSRPTQAAAASTATTLAARPVPQPLAALGGGIGHGRVPSGSGSAVRSPPPAPPPAPPVAATPAQPTYRALYDFAGDAQNQLSLKKDEIIIVLQKKDNGWWLARHPDSQDQGWTPSAYLKEDVVRMVAAPPPPPPAPTRAVPVPPSRSSDTNGSVRAKPTPPAPPSKRPVSKKPAPPPAPRDSGMSIGSSVNGHGNGSGSGSGRDTPNTSVGSISLAGGLAEALRQRQASMQGKKEEEDDW
ncbi:MAG: class II myosin [Thelocarpon superellum]|nr:MAG: class II myosin [Thelocarpon superellum]